MKRIEQAKKTARQKFSGLSAFRKIGIDYAEQLAMHASATRGAGLDACRVKPWLLEGAAAEIERLREIARVADTMLRQRHRGQWTILTVEADRLRLLIDQSKEAARG